LKIASAASIRRSAAVGMKKPQEEDKETAKTKPWLPHPAS
jgi:hypothetical protein